MRSLMTAPRGLDLPGAPALLFLSLLTLACAQLAPDGPR